MRAGVYVITNQVNGKQYVGSSVNIGKRWIAHRSALRLGNHCNTFLQQDVDQHGLDELDFRIVKLCKPEYCIANEQLLLDLLSPEYNIEPKAGSSLGRIVTAETRAKMSISHTGKRHSKETKAKISASKRKPKVVMTQTDRRLRLQNLMSAVRCAHLGAERSE